MQVYPKPVERHLRLFYNSLSEKDRRRYAAIEAEKLGHGGVLYLAELFDCDPATIRHGHDDVEHLPAEIAEAVNEQGFQVSDNTVRTILTEEIGLRRRQAVKDEASCTFAERDEQFGHIAARRAWYESRGLPVISVDTKKKEILGEFFRPGQAYTDGLLHVADHDFVTNEQRLAPYGVYDTIWDEGYFLLARGSDTSELACDVIGRWWQRLGRWHHAHAVRLLLVCDCGGSNGYRQHRLFCHATRAMRCLVLQTIEIARDVIASTTTRPGLRVVAEIARQAYEKGRRATAEFLANPPLTRHAFLPKLNYTALAHAR